MSTSKPLFQSILVASLVALTSACTTAPPVPVAIDTDVSAAAQAGGLRAALRVLPGGEANQLFGGRASDFFAVVQLKVANEGAQPISLERKWIRLLAPDGKERHPVSPFRVANMARGGAGVTSSGINALDLILVTYQLAVLARNKEASTKWEQQMPETFNLAPGQERSMLLAFEPAHWAPGLWHLDLTFKSDSGADGPRLSVPLMFRALSRPPG